MRDIVLQTRVTSALKREVGEEHGVTLKPLWLPRKGEPALQVSSSSPQLHFGAL